MLEGCSGANHYPENPLINQQDQSFTSVEKFGKVRRNFKLPVSQSLLSGMTSCC